MARLSEEDSEELRRQTVRVLLELRRMYLRTPGANVLKHWDQLQSRMRAAARTNASVGEWLTAMLRSLRIESPDRAISSEIDHLDTMVRAKKCIREWLDMLEREYGLLMAQARLESELKKDGEWKV